MSHLHIFTSRHPTFPPHSQHLEVMVLLSFKGTYVILVGDQAPLLLLSGKPNSWTQVLTSVMGGAPLTSSYASLGYVVGPRPSPWLTGRASPSSRSNHLLAHGGVTSHGAMVDTCWWQGKWKNTACKSWTNPQKCCGILEQKDVTLRQFSRKKYLLCCYKLVSKGWAPRTKGPCLIYPWMQVTEARSKV
jgi:hypothetical protein